MSDVIDVFKKSYINSINENLGNAGPAAGATATAFGFGIMKGSGFESSSVSHGLLFAQWVSFRGARPRHRQS
jgi:hypothetical protein